MDLSDLVSVRKFQEFAVEQKEELYETLLELAEAIEEIPKKSLRKTLDITFAVLRFKGEQILGLQEQLETKSQADSLDESHNDRLLDENEKLKRMLGKLEEEKQNLKHKVKELTDEILNLQKRLQDAMHSGEVSDKDSSDPLSELDKQEELLKNINAKNKHIKRLLREIEALQTQNIEQSKAIIETEKQLQQAKAKVLQLSADITLVDSERKALKETVNELHVEISRLEGNITYLEEEREKGEKDLKDFIDKLETKALSWKKLLDEKDVELKKLRTRLGGDTGKDILTESSTESDATKSTGDGNAEDTTRETTKLLHAIESRDKLIEQLELKIKTMAEEMISSTKLMNKLTAERQEEQNMQRPRSCCKLVEESLQAANDRCRELSEMLESCEENNELKCKQAMQAIAALDAYKRGEDGLVKALRKCASLEQKLKSRDKQIQALVMELNSMHEIAYENAVLRKRLNIPDDVVIATKNLAAKERSKDKMIERLTLKLRASEEIRLQLKMEKSDLRSELMQLQKMQQKNTETNLDNLGLTSEVGEVEDSTRTEEYAQATTKKYTCYCNCQDAKLSEAESDVDTKYQETIEENDILRVGMLEILEKLREYDESSENITIDTEILMRLLQALQSRGSPTAITTSRLQNELQSLKTREKALRELLIKQNTLESTEADELASVESVREDGEVLLNTTELQIELPSDLIIDTSTRPTTPNKTLDQSLFPVIQSIESVALETIPIEQIRELQIQVSELEIYRQRYEELKLHIGATECEQGEYCKDLVERLTELELINTKKSKVYEYLRKDYDQNLTELKQNELKHIATVADLKKKICELSQRNTDLHNLYEKQKTGIQYTTEEFLSLQRQNTELQAQLAFMIEQIFAGKIAPDLKINDICTDYGIIRENIQLDYMTMEEYEKLQETVKDAIDEKSKLERKCVQLEGLLEIAHEQILSQQKLLNEIADNHINLRHLVADLQSTTEDKLIMAKIQRDLDSAKTEITNFKFAREQLQQKCADLELDLKSQQLKTAQIKEDFHSQQRYKDTKLKFLQKSIFALKEKYAKFTPLIFLTNFVFAHAKFVKRTNEIEEGRQKVDNISLDLEQLITSKLAELTEVRDDSQQLIKLVKSETYNKVLEDQFATMQRTYQNLQQELTEQRLKQATDAEHWKTIEALFGTESNLEKSTKQTDVATNTDTPVPAERKLTPEVKGRRKSLIEMADKNMSPISSPDRKSHVKLKTEVGTQTSHVDDKSKTSENIASPKKVSVHKVELKERQDAIVQTSLETQKESLGVQTTAEENTEKSEHMEEDIKISTNISNIEQKLKDAKLLAEERAENLKKTTAELSLANAEIDKLRKQLDNLKTAAEETSQKQVSTKQEDFNQHAGIIEKTILSFHTLLSEKDKSISKYQDLLQTEREQTQSTTVKLNQNIDDLKSTVHNLNYNIKTKDMEILELKTKLETVSVRRNSREKLDLATGGGGTNGEDNVDNSLNEISDEKIEEMFDQADTLPVSGSQLPLITITADAHHAEKQDKEVLKENPALLKQIKELTDKASYWENTLKVKEEEINLLREKLQLYQEREKSLEHASSPEIEHLRLLLDDKDKHINELMSTLNNFHDDQLRYINDSTNSSADQITKLAADLTRTEATNKIYHTQVEALRRQLTSLTQREKQARELNQSLRSQLIKRPVVSIKTELNARVKNENLQRRIHQLELELDEARAQIQRQHIIIETKRAKSASEVSLWEKQKRWQQNAEKLKTKLEETECTLEKTRSLLQSARNAVARLEKDKQVLEVKFSRATQSHGGAYGGGVKCCRTPSCPNLHPTGGGTKYTPSESPETYTGASSECSSPAQSAQSCRANTTAAQVHHYYANNENHHSELIEALKARIELQQRKILAMELEGKGSNALTTELEKQQERFSAIEAQNIRLEAKNLQLQLDNDFLRQGDASERLQKRIKHLEDYIIALKEEMAQTEARRELCKCTGTKINTHTGQAAEQTILSLRNIVEKLRAENKYLKDGRRSTESRSSTDTPTDLTRLQQMYTESLEKISSLQIELNMKTKCPICCNRGKLEAHANNDELKFIKEQLIKKTQLLQKAKVLLTRAAAKEKVLKEQLALWKRKCSELQNVPVIDEISE